MVITHRSLILCFYLRIYIFCLLFSFEILKDLFSLLLAFLTSIDLMFGEWYTIIFYVMKILLFHFLLS